MKTMEFEIRKLKADDIFPMFKLLSKVGIKDLKTINPETLKAMNSGSADTTAVGFEIMMNLVEVLMENLPSCKTEIYSFLASLTGLSPEAISELDMATFAELVIAVVQKDDFKDFFKVVAKLFK